MPDRTEPPVSNDDVPDASVRVADVVRQLVIDEGACDSIDDHVGEDTRIESGGVLVGDVDEVTGVVTIIAAVPARRALGDSASLIFTHESWDEVNDVIGAEHPEQRMVGWYHSHPRFGIFLSEYDTFIHRNFFSAPWQVAYVVDPVLGKSGFFGWQQGDIVRYKSWSVLARGTARIANQSARSGLSSESEPTRPSLRVGLLAGALVILLVGLLLGYLVSRPSTLQSTFRSTKMPSRPVGNGLIVNRTWISFGNVVDITIRVANEGSGVARPGYIANCGPAKGRIVNLVSPESDGTSSSVGGRAAPSGSCPLLEPLPPGASNLFLYVGALSNAPRQAVLKPKQLPRFVESVALTPRSSSSR